ncbi:MULTISPECIES: hypothetical protein [Methylobacteriaceae]|uniref:hypothetical protein n=1 Tax=Methylobacteriaceae TaxID=119045 RepID=UPI00116A5500|nr:MULTISPECIES: hypothetical protein [Methylobacteriaceae]GEL42883.1 hypothetical protein MEX01_34740 [Methylorubrum extorquens]
MRTHPVLMAVMVLTLGPVGAVAQPASCRLGEASFRPLRGASEFELRSRRAGDAIGWDLVVTATGETYPFRTEVESPATEWVLVSEANTQGIDPGVRTPMTPRREDGAVAADGNGVARLSFLHLAQGFIAHRERAGRLSGAGISPPSGVWTLSGCGSR